MSRELLNDADTRRYEGNAEIESGDVIEGDVAVLDGGLPLGGRVEGDVVVVNGSLQPGRTDAEITGDVIVVGGDITRPGRGRGGRRDGGLRGARERTAAAATWWT